MGTSISQGSPKTPAWRNVAATYTKPNVPIDRVVNELWRAAQSEAACNWLDLLSRPVVASCLSFAVLGDSPERAVRLASREVALSGQSSLATDVALRAVGQSFAAKDRALGFAESLFMGATDYLVSRDLSGYVGEKARNRTAQDAIEFRHVIASRVREVVTELAPQSGSQDASEWAKFVTAVVRRLARQT